MTSGADNMVIDENEEANDMTLEQLIRTSKKRQIYRQAIRDS